MIRLSLRLAVVFVIAISLGRAKPAGAAVAGPVPRCDPAGRDLCDLNRPEDIAPLPGTDWLAISTSATDESLVFIDRRTRRRNRIDLADSRRAADLGHPALGDVTCPGPPSELHAGGNDARRVQGELRLAVINRLEQGERVELFVVDMVEGVPHARWQGCLPVPAPYSLNDVALGLAGEVYATHQFERPLSSAEGASLKQKFLSGADTGFALVWRPDAGWARVPGTDVSFANGIAVSARGNTLAVAGTFSQAILLLDLTSQVVRRVSVPLQPDNISSLRDGGFLVVGHTGIPVTGVDPCRDPKATPCGFPFAVARVSPRGEVSVLFSHDGSRIPGASVAVLRGNELYLGSSFGDRVTVLDRPPGAPKE